MYEIMQLSGQEYKDEYATRAKRVPVDQPTDDIDLSEEILAG